MRKKHPPNTGVRGLNPFHLILVSGVGFAVSPVLPSGSDVQYVASFAAAVDLCCDGTGREGCAVIWRLRMASSARHKAVWVRRRLTNLISTSTEIAEKSRVKVLRAQTVNKNRAPRWVIPFSFYVNYIATRLFKLKNKQNETTKEYICI